MEVNSSFDQPADEKVSLLPPPGEPQGISTEVAAVTGEILDDNGNPLAEENSPTGRLSVETGEEEETPTDNLQPCLSLSFPTSQPRRKKNPALLFPSKRDDDGFAFRLGARPLFRTPPRTGKFVPLIEKLVAAQKGGAADLTPLFDKTIVANLCDEAAAVLQCEPTLLAIDLRGETTLVVVGDIHGQLCDLNAHAMAQQYNQEDDAPDRTFLFLGDYVDRGPQGVEVAMLLLALKVEYPSLIYLLRGNHEDSLTSRMYGFLHEVQEKFHDDLIWAKFNEVFCFLPLAAKVTVGSHCFLALHGGLSPEFTSLSNLNEILRSDYGSMMDNKASDIVDGILWSDPTDGDRGRYNLNDRGCGYTFAPSVTNEFCKANGLEFICRAHQVVMPGFQWTHDYQCLTLFSAPNYCGFSNNLGAIMVISPGFKASFVQYDAVCSTDGPQFGTSSPVHGAVGGMQSYFSQ